MSAPSLTQTALWSRARASFARAVEAIGAPAAIAAIESLTPTLRRAITGWVCRLEHVVRRLLFVEAAVLSPSPRGGAKLQRLQVRAANAIAAPARVATPPNPHAAFRSARFSFALPRDPHAVPEANAPRIRALWGGAHPSAPPRAPHAPSQTPAALRLARRFEARPRVLEDPIPHAQRLARVLARALRRFPDIARRCALAPSRTASYDRADHRLSIDAMAAALGAADAYEETG